MKGGRKPRPEEKQPDFPEAELVFLTCDPSKAQTHSGERPND